MENRLHDLKNGGPSQNYKDSDVNESQVIIEQNDKELMPEFIARTDEAQRLVEQIKSNNERIEGLKARYQKATTSMAEKEISRQLDAAISTNSRLNGELKDAMTSIAEQVDRAKQNDPNEPETRMKAEMQNAITIKVQDTLKTSQSVQMEFRAGFRDKMARQTKLLDPTLNEDQVQELCDDPEKVQQLLQQKLYGSASVQIENAVADIQDKYRDIQKLEQVTEINNIQSVNAVFQLFQDLALLVHNQGQLIDNIELNMNAASNYVKKGEKQLMRAKEEHQSARKKMCCLVMIGLVVILVIVGPVLGTQL